MGFGSFKLHPKLIAYLEKEEITRPTKVQKSAVPVLMRGANAVIASETGSGKTLAYALPALHRFMQKEERPARHYPKIFIISPTKELAQQIYGVLKEPAREVGLRSVLLQGGGMRAQERTRLKKGADVIVATPQRAYEYVNERLLDIKAVRYMVIDEADMMLDMGFVGFAEFFLARMSPKVQKVMVSATVTKRVLALAKQYFGTFKHIELTPSKKIAETITQRLYPCVKSKKTALLEELIIQYGWEKVLVFVRKKEVADELAKELRTRGLECDVLHGERKHFERQRILRRFKEGDLSMLIATDIVARGLDIKNLPVVVNYDIPHVKHDFIHRVGRTGRAGKEGLAVSLISVEEMEQLNDLTELLGEKIEEIILPEYAPKIVKARGWLIMPPRKKRRSSSAQKTKKVRIRDPKNPRGKKRKTTKRDRGF
jgi:ATP-dependent RNA helicase RhlE